MTVVLQVNTVMKKISLRRYLGIFLKIMLLVIVHEPGP